MKLAKSLEESRLFAKGFSKATENKSKESK